ncbi:MAG: Asp-tRNA(Asn)/Glu-tRNA(Gln) amidotransferase subunit GatA [Bacteroidota bacterium]
MEYRRLAEIQRDLSTRSITLPDLVEFYLSQIPSQPQLNVFLEVFEEEARQAAVEIQARWDQGQAGRLAGLVLGIKDVLCYQGHRLGASSRMLEGFESQITATAVQRLLDEDAIIIGRQNCDEFAMGSSNENSAYGPTLNPRHESYVPGGSSGASAAAVAANLCMASLGSDTGGSVRQPAAYCGVVGLKPSYGRVSRWGLIAYASSFDQIGPITRSVEDAELLLEIMAGPDGRDQTAAQIPHSKSPFDQAGSFRFGVLSEVMESPGLDPGVRQVLNQQIEKLVNQGHQVVNLSFPLLEYLVPCYYILTTAEASSNLSRYDGVHYGYRASEVADLEELYLKTRSQGFGKEVQRRILLGNFVLSAEHYEAYYTQAMKVRRLIAERTQELLTQCDFLLTPTAPSTAFKIGEKTSDPIEMFLSDVFTVHANLAGIPAISVPGGIHENGLPIGLQLMGKAYTEATLLQGAKVLEGLMEAKA